MMVVMPQEPLFQPEACILQVRTPPLQSMQRFFGHKYLFNLIVMQQVTLRPAESTRS